MIKKLFSTPKRAIISTACIAVVVVAIAVGIFFATGLFARSSSIGEANAQNFAFTDAGVDPASAQLVKTSFDRENGRYIYEVEFYANGVEYEYWIDAENGAVLRRDSDGQVAGGGSAAQASISEEEARNAALADAGVDASDATFITTRLDYDDGRSVYDVEFYTATQEYDYEIDATTSAVYSKKTESFQTGTSGADANAASASISVDDAKAAAVADAGLSLSDVTFSKAKLERDDGRTLYEIEFYQGSTQYEYSIDATTGAVLEYETDAH